MQLMKACELWSRTLTATQFEKYEFCFTLQNETECPLRRHEAHPYGDMRVCVP
jgi:hypothetical protein